MKEPIKQTWHISAKAVAPKTAEISLNGFIDLINIEDMCTSSGGYISQFKSLEAENDVIRLNIGACYGGACTEGLAMFNTNEQSSKKVITSCSSLAASMAAILFLSGEEREMVDTARLMYHGVSNMLYGKIPELQIQLAETIVTQDTLAAIMLKTAKNKTAEDVAELLSKDSFMSAQEAYEWGFCTKIIPSKNKPIDESKAQALDAKAMYELYASAIATPSPFDKIAQSFKAIFKPTAKAPIIHSLNPKNKMPLQYNAIVSAEVSMYVDSAGDAPVVGENAFTDEGLTTPAPDGDYMISGGDMDGQTIVIAGGAISEIKPAEGAPAPDAITEPTDATATALAEITAKYNAVTSRLTALEKRGTTPHTVVPGANDHQQASAKKEPLSYSQQMAMDAAAEAEKPKRAWTI